MSVQLNHTIVWCRDKQKSATFLAEILGLPPPTCFGPFLVVALGNDVSLDFHETDGEIAFQHYAFLVGEDEFDQVFGASAHKASNTGLTPAGAAPAESTPTTAAAGRTSKTPTDICLRSSPALTAAAVRTRRSRPPTGWPTISLAHGR